MAQEPLQCRHCRTIPLQRSRRSRKEELLGWLTATRPYRCPRCMQRTWHRIRWRDNPGQFLLPRLLLLAALAGGAMLQFPALRPSFAGLGQPEQAPPQPAPPQPVQPVIAARPLPAATNRPAPAQGPDQGTSTQTPARPATGIEDEPSSTPAAPAVVSAEESADREATGATAAIEPEPRTGLEPAPAESAPPQPFYRPTANVNLRSGPGTRFLKLALLTPDSRLQLLGQTEGEWELVTDGDIEGWIFRPLIKAE